ncbi:MAG: DnaJ domain-containing protein [Deltaproteobacteria bacterium]|jgi:curved DNA-binding protein|nr:DnaJ domain-containing protein [Deltaproteobacteria bacterium]
MAVEYKDYYKLLGVSRDASKDEISKAYKKLARKYHPDLNQGDAKAEEKFKDINEAHEVLKDQEKRRLYDQLGSNWQHGQNFQRPPGFEGFNFGGFGGGSFGQAGGAGFDASSFSDFFETLFGGAGGAGRGGQGQSFGPDPFGGFSQRARRGRDIEAELGLSLEEAYHGGRKTVNLNTGQGQRVLEVTIPAGVKEGARIRLSGQGDPGIGGQAGDLYLKIKLLPHAKFSLEQNNLVHDLALAPWEAALGAKVRVPTLDGEVEINIPAGSSSGKKLRLRGKGLGSGAAKGDEFIRMSIRVPESLTDEEKELWERLAAVSQFKAR